MNEIFVTPIDSVDGLSQEIRLAYDAIIRLQNLNYDNDDTCLIIPIIFCDNIVI
jgi:hypothetical protein